MGKFVIVFCSLYGGKYSVADHWRHFRSAVEEMGLLSCKADPDVWLQSALKSNGV